MNDINDIFSLADKQPEPQRGSLIIAKPTVDDDCFARSVIVTINHSSNGSMGLIINRPTGITLNDVIPGLVTDEQIPLFLGGPVDCDMLFYLHTLGDIIPDSRPVMPGLYIGGEYDSMKRYINNSGQVFGKMKFILGYSGWAAGQLAAEIDRHDWAIVMPGNAEMIMREGGGDIWRESVANLGERYRMWLNWPIDLSMN